MKTQDTRHKTQLAILICAIIFVATMHSRIMQAQVPPPGIEWTTEDFYPFNPPFPAQAQVPQTKDESNEDWWYNHKNVYIGGQHVGYIAVGYTSFSNYFYNEDATGCALTLPFPLNQTSDCISDDYPITGISPAYTGRSAFQYISHKDLFGHNIWTKVVNQNWFQNVIQTTDGGFLAVGITGSSREPYYDSGSQPAALVVNPGLSQFDLNCSSPTDKSVWHINAVKFDINGNIVWNRLYATDLDKFYGAYDICEYVDANSQPAYRIVGAIAQLPQVIGISDNKYPLNAFVVDILENGDVNWMQEYAATNQGAAYGRDLYGIEAMGTGANQVIVAVGRDAGIGSGTDVNMMAWQGASLTYTTPLVLTENLTSINDAAYDVVFRNDGTFLVGVTSNSNDFGLAGGFTGNGNKAEGAVRSYTVIGTNIININDYALTDNTIANQLYAYDLKVGICNTADGGFAAVSTKRPAHYNAQWGIRSWSCNGGSTITSAYLYGDYWNTDAFVKKFDINGTPQWEKTFDENSTEQPEFYPGNLKKQECMYGITEAEDGGFVISGNYSSNMDDAYLAKLYPNCENNLVYDIDGYDGIPNSWNLIDASTLPNPLTGAHNIRGVIAVGPGLNFTIGNAASTSLKFADSRQTGIPTYIVVLPGGQLNIEGTQTTLDVEQGCNDYTMWDGIEVWGQPTLSNSFANQGVCYIKDGATIKNARMAAMACSGLRDGLLRLNPNFINGGGYIRASYAKFENCRRSIHYGPYYASSAFNFIADCDFETNAPMRDKYYQNFVDPYFRPVGNNAFVTDYRSNGLLVTRNNFKVFYNFDEDIRGTAVGSYDSRINIDNNIIWRLTTGIETVNGSAVLTPVTATDNTITAQYGFTGLSGAFHSIKNNQFNIPIGGIGFTTPYGIAMISSPAFTIEGNTFDGVTKSENFGVIVHNSNQMGGVVGKTNTFNNINVATQTEYNNDFLQISCNTYNDNTFDWAISPEFPALGTLATQGTGCDPVNKIRAGNTFNVNTNGAFSHIFTPGVQFKYYANGTPGETVPTLISPILANGNFEDVENCFNGPDAVSCTKPNPCPTLPCDDLKMAYQKENNAQLKKQFFNEWISINSLNDSINNDSILVDFISKSNDENKDVLLLKHFFDKQQFSFASTYLANIKGKPQHVSEFNIYTYLLSKVVNGQLKLNKKDKQELKSYSEQSGAGAYVAQAYLKNIFNVNSKFTPELIGNKTPRLAVNNNSIRENTIKLFPQPASETVVVHCITNDIGSGFLTINEITGKHIETIALSNINAEIILQVADLFSGVYVLQLHNVSGETLGYHKLVIAK